ncbi:fibronectin type III domain-containing protein [Flavobacterium soli]|uniref:fibronectin type III domain-containing protein n=1 Tax=Flavobacterium soli TaxID=344881 RepID=UPI00041A1D67|nr:fibronectin type III domain-containing protein [Flavobacterium soli]
MKKITFYCLLVLLSIITEAAAQCTNGTAYSSNVYTPIYDNNEYQINGNAYTGKYRLINTLSTAVIYNFRSSETTDYITITDANGIQVFASGLSGSNGINFTPPYPQVVRFYVHLNAQCESDPFINSRWNYLKTTIVTYPCDSPSNLSVSNITSNSAKVSWNEPVIGTNFSYEVYANTTGIAPTANTNPTVLESVGTNAQLTGLNSNSTYYYWVRNDCVADAGIWVPGGSFTTTVSSGCNSATYGLYPENTFSVLCNGTVQQIANNIFAGSYSNVYINNGQQYTFSSSVSTDFITITYPTGATVYASGQTPLVWIGNSSGNIRYYLHSNANCGSESISRVKSIKCGGDVIGGCTDGDLYPTNTYTPTCTGSLELIANDSWAGEYANINVTTNKNYTFSTSAVSDYITIVNPTGNIVLATGESPLVWNSGTMSGVIRYFIHANSNCGTQNINRQRYIQCSASTTCGLPTNLLVSNITANSCQLAWTAPATVPSSGYDIYI